MSIIVSILDSGGSERMLTVDHYEIIRRKVRDGMSQRDLHLRSVFGLKDKAAHSILPTKTKL